MRFELQVKLASFEFFHVQQVVDQLAQALTVVLGNTQQAFTGRWQAAGGTVTQQADRAADSGQRGTQLMADGGQEFAFQITGPADLGNVVHYYDGRAGAGVFGVKLTAAAQYLAQGLADGSNTDFNVVDCLAAPGAQ